MNKSESLSTINVFLCTKKFKEESEKKKLTKFIEKINHRNKVQKYQFKIKSIYFINYFRSISENISGEKLKYSFCCNRELND